MTGVEMAALRHQVETLTARLTGSPADTTSAGEKPGGGTPS